MNRLFLFSFAVFFFGLTSCSGNSPKQKESVTKQVLTQKNTKKMNVEELTAEAFKQKVMNYDKHPDKWVFEGTKPAIIDFYATWCGPCKMLSPIIDEMSNKYDGKVDFYKIDVDKQEELAAVFGIRSIPTLLFIPKEGEPTIMQGAMSKTDMDSTIQKLLLSQGK